MGNEACKDGVCRESECVDKVCRTDFNLADVGIKHDSEKVRLDLIPTSLLNGVGEVLTFGANKYGDRNWEEGLAWSRVYGALLRHVTAWWDGETLDPESGLHHLKHAACNLAFLIEFLKTHKGGDDRKPGRENAL
jgi:hypothetical protein